MAGRAVEMFAEIRPEVVARLLDGRGALQLGLAAQSSEMARAQVDALLARIVGCLAEPVAERHRGFMVRWVAYHLGEGFSPENLVHSIVTTGDVLVQVARRRLPPDLETAVLVRDLVRTISLLARLVVDVLGAELSKLDGTDRGKVTP